MGATRDDDGTWAVGFGKPGHLVTPPRCAVTVDLSSIAAKIRRRAADYSPGEASKERQNGVKAGGGIGP